MPIAFKVVAFSVSVTALPNLQKSITGFISKLSLQSDLNTKEGCESAGGKLDDFGYCEICSSRELNSCKTESECKVATGYWCGYDNWCYSSSSNNCPKKTKTECESVGKIWCQERGFGPYYGAQLGREDVSELFFCVSPGQIVYDCKCSKDGVLSHTYCITQSECEAAGFEWTNSINIENDYTGELETFQLKESVCQPSSQSTPKCSKDNFELCETERNCISAGGYWDETARSGILRSDGTIVETVGECIKPTASDDSQSTSKATCQNSPDLCGDKNSCESAGHTWNTNRFTTGTCVIGGDACKNMGGVWCGDIENNERSYCIEPTSTEWEWASKKYVYDESGNIVKDEKGEDKFIKKQVTTADCLTCTQEGDPQNCKTKEKCAQVGGEWMTNFDKSYGEGYGECRSCSIDRPFNCDTKNKCEKVGAKWCSSAVNSYCDKECYENLECSTERPWLCISEEGCKNKGNKWCTTKWEGISSPTGKAIDLNYCANKCHVCTDTNPWACFTQNDCELTGKNQWCKTEIPFYADTKIEYNYCNIACYNCASSSLYGCVEPTGCKQNGGTWCDAQLVGGKTIPPYCTQGTCETIKSVLPKAGRKHKIFG